jgi:lipoic acid synthetase
LAVHPLIAKARPEWLKIRPPSGQAYVSLRTSLRDLELHTVCEEARCPNVGECWSGGTATVMLLGDVCTRGCRFCAVSTGNPRGVVDRGEPARVAAAAARWGLKYIVLTQVDRDDLPDGGADVVARTVEELRAASPEMLVEVLVGDFAGKARSVDRVLEARPDVFAHNLETVERLTPTVRDRRATYAQSLEVLSYAKRQAPGGVTKSSIMLGLGERDEEVRQAMADLRAAGVDIVTFGQYLQPTARHLAVESFVAPEKYAAWREEALAMGFLYCASGPLVRSSYRAGELFLEAMLADRRRAVTARGP